MASGVEKVEIHKLLRENRKQQDRAVKLLQGVRSRRKHRDWAVQYDAEGTKEVAEERLWALKEEEARLKEELKGLD